MFFGEQIKNIIIDDNSHIILIKNKNATVYSILILIIFGTNKTIKISLITSSNIFDITCGIILVFPKK